MDWAVRPLLWGGAALSLGLAVAIPKDGQNLRIYRHGRRLRGAEEVTAAEFNRRGVPTVTGRTWNIGSISQAARKLGFARPLEQSAAERAQAKAALDGIARHRGIDREPPLTDKKAPAQLTRRRSL